MSGSADSGARFWLISAAAVAGTVVAAMLGHWQLTRAWDKEALQAAIQSSAQRPPLDIATVVAQMAKEPTASSGKSPQTLHQRVTARGNWLPAHTVFLENRQMDAKPGFYVVTPLRLHNSDAVVLVQRGWVQRNFQDRTVLPAVITPEGAVNIEGRIAPPPAKLVDLGQDGAGPIRQNLDMAAFARETGLPLWPLTLVQTAAVGNKTANTASPPDGLLRNWPVPANSAGKNYGYAFQWFALGALISSLYVWFQFGKPYLKRHAK